MLGLIDNCVGVDFDTFERRSSRRFCYTINLKAAVSAHLSPSLIKLLTEKLPCNKKYKTPTFTGFPPHVKMLTMLEAIRTYQDGMADELFGNFVAELRKKGTFDDFSEERMQ